MVQEVACDQRKHYAEYAKGEAFYSGYWDVVAFSMIEPYVVTRKQCEPH